MVHNKKEDLLKDGKDLAGDVLKDLGQATKDVKENVNTQINWGLEKV